MKDLLKFITCGSVDDGKSTLIGHILYDAKLIYADQKKALELDSKIGSRGGEIDYSLLLDGLMAEREQGITIDVAYRYFTTNNRSFIVADTPGHEEYTRNMAVGASFADLAIILIDATKGVLVQTKRHARICSLMGIKHYVFAVNKIDLINYDEERFKSVENEIENLKDELSLGDVYVIPVSATEGDNVNVKSEKTPWYKGDSILEYLENVDVGDNEDCNGFYMPVQRVCRPDHTFRGFQGQVESGRISVGDEITTLPSNEKALVKSINIGDRNENEAYKGQPVTITLSKEVDVSRGCVITKDTNLSANKAFTATILWMDDSKLVCGKDYLVKLGTKTIGGIVADIKYKIDVNSGEHINADTISKNEIAVCNIILSEEVVLSRFEEFSELGEFILIDRITNMTSACGTVQEVEDKNALKEDIYSFEYNDLKARGDIFEEFYYKPDSFSVYKYKPALKKYTVGDEIPVNSESYNYPENFDVLVFRDWTAIKVRNKKIEYICSIDNYEYGNVPIINGRGFAVKAESSQEVKDLLNAYKVKEDETAFLSKWVIFDKYRKVIFHKNF